MNKSFPAEFVFQVFALIIAVIIVHAAYVAVIRPNANAFLEQEHAQMKANPEYVAKRSVYVLVKDFEQEACFILMLWAYAILGFKGFAVNRQHSLLDRDLLVIAEGTRVLPEDTGELSGKVQGLPDVVRGFLLPRALLMGLQRFAATRDIHAVSTATRDVCESEGERLESELSMISYIVWAIPSIGFIGTVRGIGDALGQAHKAVEGDITGVTQSLGVAFNSTLIALLISIVLMFFVHQLQLMQERLVLDTEAYCDQRLIRHLQNN